MIKTVQNEVRVTYYFNFAIWFDVIIIYESSKSCCILGAINTV